MYDVRLERIDKFDEKFPRISYGLICVFLNIITQTLKK